MLKDISKVKVTGANFETATELDIFNPHEGDKTKTTKGALVYGRNGTGKSTIAKAFRKLAGETVPSISSAELYNDENQVVKMNEGEQNPIFVFDEDYVDKNVRLKDNYLETIVMLGPIVDLEDEIDEANQKLHDAEVAYGEQSKLYEQYINVKDIKSPKYYIAHLKDLLKGDDSWAGRDKEIHGGRQNTSVRDDTYKKFVSLTPAKSKIDLITDYKEKIRELTDAKSGATSINQKVPELPSFLLKYDDCKIEQLLAETIEKPKLSDREKKLLALVEKGKSLELEERVGVLRTPNVEECPYCFQPLAVDYKAGLAESIEKVLNKEVKEHQSLLRSCMRDPIELNLELYQRLNNYQKCVDLIAEINTLIVDNNEDLHRKFENPYESITDKRPAVIDAINECVLTLEKLEDERVKYNNDAQRTEPIVKELDRINSEIAHYDIKDLAVQLKIQEKECEDTKKEVERLRCECQTKKIAVEKLEARRKNVELAIDSINACMKYIFFAEDRLKIEYEDGVYKLLSRGKHVKPCDVSVGERNIIGLSYFFTNLLAGKEEQNAYKEEYLLVLDDPVSSFDLENKIGILSFLKHKIGMFLKGNINSKILVMTHDIQVFYDMNKLLNEIMDSCKTLGWPGGPKINFFELRNRALTPFSFKKRQEYTELLESIYKYAKDEADEYEVVIGNMMRQALEAFSTFEYRKGIEAVSVDSKVLGLLPEEAYRLYYENLMYRLVLHGGSHKEEQIKTMNDYNFFSLISKAEKRRTAKDILCFIYLLNRIHLLEHLAKFKDTEDNMESWCEDIKSRATII